MFNSKTIKNRKSLFFNINDLGFKKIVKVSY